MSSQFAIVNHCQKKWGDLNGDGRQRHGDACQTSVYAIDDYSQKEWGQLWRESSGRVCGFLCEEPFTPPRSRRAVLLGALLTAISPLMAQTGRVRIRMTAPNGAVIPGAEASLLGADDKSTRTAQTDEAGEIVFADLPIGNCRLMVWAPGFQKRLFTATIGTRDEVKIEAALEIGFVGEVVMVKPHKRWRWRWLIFR